MMEQRKMLILKEIVDRYIKKEEPVSSQMLLEEYKLPVSSATIRNDMHYLEEQGYIERAYSSSGRIPTEKGYRFFVDWLGELSELTKLDQHSIMERYSFQRQEIDELLKSTAFLLANITRLVGFVLSPKLEETHLEHITMVKLGSESVMVVIVSNLGIMESRIINVEISQEELEEINLLLNSKLQGRRLDEIRDEAIRFFDIEEGAWVDPVMKNSFALLRDVIEEGIRRRLYVEGILNLMESIFNSEDRTEKIGIIRLLGDERKFAQALEEGRREEITALIGGENSAEELHNYSLIIMDYGYSGLLGVLGPIRMDYSKAFSAAKYIGNRLKTILMVSGREEGVKE